MLIVNVATVLIHLLTIIQIYYVLSLSLIYLKAGFYVTQAGFPLLYEVDDPGP